MHRLVKKITSPFTKDSNRKILTQVLMLECKSVFVKFCFKEFKYSFYSALNTFITVKCIIFPLVNSSFLSQISIQLVQNKDRFKLQSKYKILNFFFNLNYNRFEYFV